VVVPDEPLAANGSVLVARVLHSSIPCTRSTGARAPPYPS
jgi:hypothetical protein